MIHLGTQYYRPPFPESRYWEDDLRGMKDAGLNTVQLWVIWAWVEAVPGTFRFDDYDRIVELADRHGLSVVLSAIAEVQPYWIHREVPGSEMISSRGQSIMSGNRNECHFGITPGGCCDHPGVWARMSAFLEQLALRYRGAPNLHGWDAWNELRWNVHADAVVCCCEHTLREFRQWLDRRYGGLDGLNEAWKTRYGQWDEVAPDTGYGRPFTRNTTFCHFLTWRACRHAKQRYDVLKGLDPDHPVTLHGGAPSAGYPGSGATTALDRGNDWFFADDLDGVGTSSFPKWQGIDDADFGIRVEFVKSAARGKHVWLSELQGGRAATGFDVHEPVDAPSQQRWIWNGLACGADTILFWCWRDEVFCREAGGFGLIGLDGHAAERLEAMKVTGRALAAHVDLLDAYVPAQGEVGVLFSPQTYYHHWASEGTARRAYDALSGYARSLVRCSIPYTVVEEEHLEALDGLKILFLPRTTTTSSALESALAAFVRNGGTLVCESECGAFNPEGLYRIPADRFTTALTGRAELGRRKLSGPTIDGELDDEALSLDVTQWLTPHERGSGTSVAACEEGDLISITPVGKGRVVLCAGYLGEEYYRRQRASEASAKLHSADFEWFVGHLVHASGWSPEVEILSPRPEPDRSLYVKSGTAGDRRLLFVFFQEGQAAAHLRFRAGFFCSETLVDILSGEKVAVTVTAEGKQELELIPPARGFAVLSEVV